jgi:hypothetical protein
MTAPATVEDLVQKQIEKLRILIEPRLRDAERPSYEIRPGVSHGDIEIFLNGRLYPVFSDHFQKVQDANVERSFVEQLLALLRSRKYEFTGGNLIYTLRNVQQEVLAVLSEVLERSLGEKELEEVAEKIDTQLREYLQLEDLPEELPTSAQKAAIRLVTETLVASKSTSPARAPRKKTNG